MKEKKTIFDYLAQALRIFGFIMVVLNVFALFLGEYAMGDVSIFSLGDKGISTSTAFQFLAFSLLVVLIRYIFFTRALIRRMSLPLRAVCLTASLIALVALFSVLFHWFPVDMWQSWVVFFICFAVSLAGSSLITAWKEKAENRQLQEALERYKKAGDKDA